MFDLSRYSQLDVQRTHDEREDGRIGLEAFVFRPYHCDFLINRLGVSFCPPWMFVRFRIADCDVLLCPLFLAQRGRLNIEVPKEHVCVLEVLPGHAHTESMVQSYGQKIMINRFEASMLIREAIR